MLTALLEITVITLLVAANGFLAGSEIAVVSARRGRLRHRSEGGDAGAAKALALLGTPNRFLSTVQIGITAIGVVGGAFGGTRVALTLAPALAGLGVPEAAAHEVAILVVVAAITYVMLVVGELVPKRIALHDPERVSARVASPMLWLSSAATPLVRVLSASTDLVLRLVPMRPRDEAEVAEDEIRSMIAHATETGVLEATEQQIVERLFRLSDKTVEMLMTPRERIVWLDRQASPNDWRERMNPVRHTRYLVCDGDLDQHVGYVNVQELLGRCLQRMPLDLNAVLRKPHVIERWTPAFRVLERFQWSGDHIAIVTETGGEVAGVVTLNDVLEGIVGDIPETYEVTVPGVIEREDGSWLVDGLLPFDEFVTVFDVQPPAGRAFDTVHAFMVANLEERPRPAAVFRWQGLRLEIVDMDGSRIDKVLVERAG